MSSRMLCTLPQEGKASLKLFLDYAPEDELPPIPSVSSLEQLTSPTSLSLMQLPETSNLSELSLHELEMRQSALHEQQRQLNRAEIGITSHMEALGLDATNVSTDVSSSSGAKAKGQKFVWQRGRLLGKGVPTPKTAICLKGEIYTPCARPLQSWQHHRQNAEPGHCGFVTLRGVRGCLSLCAQIQPFRSPQLASSSLFPRAILRGYLPCTSNAAGHENSRCGFL